MDINLKDIFNCIKAFVDLLSESLSERIINLASLVGIFYSTTIIADGEAKAGDISLKNAFSK